MSRPDIKIYVIYNVYNAQHISIFLSTLHFFFAFSLALRAAPPLRARKRRTMSPSYMGGWFVAFEAEQKKVGKAGATKRNVTKGAYGHSATMTKSNVTW